MKKGVRLDALFYYTNLLFARVFHICFMFNQLNFYIMTNLNHITDYLEIKDDIKSLKKKIKNCSITGEIMGRKNELFVELLDEYIKLLKRQSWEQEYLR